MSSDPGEGNRVIVVGAGPMGLAAGYYAARKGYQVDVVEAGDRVGGMAAHFDFGGLSLERYYHFCCLSDHDTFTLLEDLGMGDAIQWKRTTMGYYINGALHDWGDPVSLLKFPELNIVEKFRYGLQAFLSTKRSDYERLDKISAEDWFIAWCGRGVYERMWRPLLYYKFYQHADKVSAAWMWQRIKRLGNSRKSLFEERLGFIEGGSEALMIALAKAIEAQGGNIKLNAPVTEFLVEDNAVKGVQLANGETLAADQVISTMPTPYVSKALENSAPQLAPQYGRIKNVGVVCVTLKLKRSVTPYFWVNFSHPGIEIPGFVEFSNLRPLDNHIVYVPFYMPQDRNQFSREDSAFIADSMACLKTANPEISDNDLIAGNVARLTYAQPVCEVDFAKQIPPVQTPIKGLQIADTCFYYPEDRGVSESIRFAKLMVEDLAGTART